MQKQWTSASESTAPPASITNLLGDSTNMSDPFVERLTEEIRKSPEIVERFRNLLAENNIELPEVQKVPDDYLTVYHGTDRPSAESLLQSGPLLLDAVVKKLGRGFYTATRSLAKNYAYTKVSNSLNNNGLKNPNSLVPALLEVNLKAQATYVDMRYRMDPLPAFEWFSNQTAVVDTVYEFYRIIVGEVFAKEFFEEDIKRLEEENNGDGYRIVFTSLSNASSMSTFALLLGADIAHITHKEPGLPAAEAYEDQILILRLDSQPINKISLTDASIDEIIPPSSYLGKRLYMLKQSPR